MYIYKYESCTLRSSTLSNGLRKEHFNLFLLLKEALGRYKNEVKEKKGPYVFHKTATKSFSFFPAHFEIHFADKNGAPILIAKLKKFLANKEKNITIFEKIQTSAV